MRTYYCVEMGAASYPVGEIYVKTRPFSDPLTNRAALRVRASSKTEAEEIARNRLESACEEALRNESN